MKTRFGTVFRLLSVLCLAVWAVGPRAVAEAPAGIAIQAYAGLTITGAVGTVYTVQYTTDLAQSNDWRAAGIVQLPGSPYLWVDTTAPATGRRFYRAVEGPTNLVWIPPGTFTMGNPSNALDSQEIVDGPQTVVTLTRGFFIGKYEATQGEYLAVTGSNPSEFRNGTPSCCGGTGGVVTNELVHPVERVNWFDATNYCARLTDRERVVGRTPAGWVYRLPTEAEWEYACRGGTTSAFHYGPALRSGMANFFGQHEYEFSAGETTNPTGIYFGRTTVVGSYEANGWGLYDMHGNVFEWCWDWFSNPLAGGRVIDPQGPSIGSRRVIRGGSWATIGRACLSAYRPSFFFPVDRSRDFGFRVVLSPVQ